MITDRIFTGKEHWRPNDVGRTWVFQPEIVEQVFPVGAVGVSPVVDPSAFHPVEACLSGIARLRDLKDRGPGPAAEHLLGASENG